MWENNRQVRHGEGNVCHEWNVITVTWLIYKYVHLLHVLLKICFKFINVDNRFRYAGHRPYYSYERLTCIRLALIWVRLRCICAILQPQTVGACYWACSKTICAFQGVLHSSALICDHISHLPTMSAVYLSLTCVNLHFSALLEVQTDADWRSSVECQY